MRHPVYDKDPHFTIDMDTRALIPSMKKVSLIQGDHNSERFSFDLPAEIEGHSLINCDKVEVHFVNIDLTTKAQSKGFYTVDDMEVHPDDPTKVVCSWLIDGRATKYVGSLSFVIRVTCLDGSNLLYAWHTAIFSGITVSDGICNTEAVLEEYVDVLAEWAQGIEAGRQALEKGLQLMESSRITNFEQTQIGASDGGVNEWAMTTADGRTMTLQVQNGSRGPAGPTGLVGSIETVDGKRMDFFHGTEAEYNALPVEKKANLFAVITDEEFDAKVVEAVEYASGVAAGTTKVKVAETADALSSALYMVCVSVSGTTSANTDAGSVAAYFSYIGSTKRDGVVSHTNISNDLWKAGVYKVPASGFYQGNTGSQPSRVIAVDSTDTGGTLRFIVTGNTDGVESPRSITSSMRLEFLAKSQKLTGGQ